MRLLYRLAASVCLTLACAGADRASPPLPEPTPSDLLGAAQQANIEGRTYRLEAHLWRDFMPRVDPTPGEAPLICSVRVHPHSVRNQPDPPPRDLAVDRLWVIHRGAAHAQIWQPGRLEEVNAHMPNPLEKIGRGGPPWEPGTRVDVVVRLVHPAFQPHLLRAAGQTIEATH